MDVKITIMTAVMLLTLFAPFGVYYAVKMARKKEYKTHRKIQSIIFVICVIGVLALYPPEQLHLPKLLEVV